MGLAGFNRARQRLSQLEGASAPSKYKPFVKQDITQKHYCAYCDKHFNNIGAYNKHMMFKHTQDFADNNPDVEIPITLQHKLKKET